MLNGIRGPTAASMSIGPVHQTEAVKEINTVEEFAQFLKENGARVEEARRVLTLYIGEKNGRNRVGSQLWTRPDPTTGINVYVESNKLEGRIDFDLPETITVVAPKSSAKIPATLLTKETILKAKTLAGL